MIKEEKKVFKPNATTSLLVQSSLKTIKKKSDILDLGCGTGLFGKEIGQVCQYIEGVDLSKKMLDKSFKPKLILKMNDYDAISYLSELRQIGKWSAEMILLFTFNRPNIWPIQDIGLLRAISKNYKKNYLPPAKFVETLKKRFSPYCSVATWYLWRSIDPEPIQY